MDIQFAYFLLQSRGAVPSKILNDYITRKTGGVGRNEIFSGGEAFWKLEEILNDIRRGRNTYRTERMKRDNKMIIMD